MSKVVAFIAGLVVPGMFRRKCFFTMMSCSLVLYLFCMLQFFGCEGVGGCRGGGNRGGRMGVSLLDFSKFVYVPLEVE